LRHLKEEESSQQFQDRKARLLEKDREEIENDGHIDF